MPSSQLDAILHDSTPQDAVTAWLETFERAIKARDAKAASALFAADSHWRDMIAFTWHLETVNGVRDIETFLSRRLAEVRPRNFAIAEGRTPPTRVERAGVDCVEAIISFETAVGNCSGVLRLIAGDGDGAPKAWLLATSLDQITGHEERTHRHRPTGKEFSGGFGAENWLDRRNHQRAYEDHEPTVLVVGGGQAGLGIGACLGRLGLDTLIVDRHERVGDAWRKRYHNLVLHNEVFVNHLPYMPFPPNWPVYIPKDLLANFFEAYADAMELNIWGGTEIASGSYDDASGTWSITLRRADGSDRVVKPRHVIFATGVSSIPIRPDFPGLETFSGTVMHSGDYKTGHPWKGRNALVFGTGNSGHDVAHDLHNSGADVTLVQRNTTLVVSLKEAQRIYKLYQGETPLEDCDLIASAAPYPLLVKNYKLVAAKNAEEDKELLDGLRARGFRLDNGPPDDTGYQMKYLRRGGGYYFNVGASDLIVDGSITLEHFENMDRFEPAGARMKDGSLMPADLVVTATGYKNQQDVVRQFMGDRIADKIGPVWGFGDDGEQRNMWRRTAQPGLWFTGGGLPHVRIFSKYLAMQIKAIEAGMISKNLPDRPELAEAAE